MAKKQSFRVAELYEQLAETRLSPIEAGEKLKQLIQEFDLSLDEALELSTEFASRKGMAISDLVKFMDASGVDQMLNTETDLNVEVTKSDSGPTESTIPSERLLRDFGRLIVSPAITGLSVSQILPPLVQKKTRPLDLLIFDIDQPLTPQFMADTLIPYLQAVANLQQTIDDVQGRPRHQVHIKSIKEGSALWSLLKAHPRQLN